MSIHRRPAGLLTPIRITLALALSVAVLPFTAVSSSADEEVVVDETIVETEEQVGEELAPPVQETLSDPPPDSIMVATDLPLDDVEPPDVLEPAELRDEEDSRSEENGFKVALRSLLSGLDEVVGQAVCDPGYEVGPYGGEAETNFEIDGDTDVDCPGNDDWVNHGAAVPDEVNTASAKDSTNFSIGSSENLNPADWEQGVGTAPPKDDISSVRVWNTTLNDGHIWSFFAFTRVATNGTTSYDVEYNQKPNSSIDPPRPNRTQGDLLLQFDQKGTDTKNRDDEDDVDRFALKAVWEWRTGAYFTGSSCTMPIDGYEDDNGDPMAAGWCRLDLDSANFRGDVSADGEFAEGAVDITAIRSASGLPSTCQGAFGTMNIRSFSSQQETSALKDYVLPQAVNIPGTCATLKIEKVDKSDPTTRIGGATFLIAPNPTPGTSGGNLSVTDNDANDEDDRLGYIEIAPVEPRTYTVTETAAPTDYLLPPPLPAGVVCADQDQSQDQPYRCQVLTVGSSGTATFVFEDPKVFAAPTVVKNVDATFDASYVWSVDKGVRVPVSDGEPNAYATAATQNLPEADPGPTTADFEYRVTASVTRTTSNYEVSGTIWVVNTNTDDMVVTLSDELSNGDDCSFPELTDHDGNAENGFQVLVEGGADETGGGYAYECAQSASDDMTGPDGTNTATISWDKAVYPQNQNDVDALTDSDSATPGFGEADTDHPDHGPLPYSFAPTGDDDTSMEIIDDKHPDWAPAYPDPWILTWQQDGDDTYSETRTYTRTIQGEPGTCTPPDVNRAWVDLDGDGSFDNPVGGESEPNDTASAVVCVGSDLAVSKVTTSSLTRTYPYTIEKSVEAARVDADPATGEAEVEYAVVVTDGACEYSANEKVCTSYADSQWAMVSTVTLTNTNDWQDITVTELADVYIPSGDGAAAIEPVCTPEESGPWTVPAASWDGDTKTNGELEVVLNCTFGSEPPLNGTNRATATWGSTGVVTPGTSAFGEDPVVEADWALTKVNDVVDVVDFLVDEVGVEIPGTRESLGTVEWVGVGHEHSTDEEGSDGPHLGFTYTRTLEGVEGECVTYDNRAQVMSQGEEPAVLDSDDASVDVCMMTDLNVTKNGAGTFHRDYDWDIEKWILVEQNGQIVEVDEQTAKLDSPNIAHVFGYRVEAVPLPLAADADSGWAVEGTITVDNPNSAEVEDATEVTISELPNMGAGAQCDVVDGTYQTVDGLTVTVTDGVVSVPAEDAVVIDYECTFTSAPQGTKENLYAGNTNQAKITWGDEGEDLSDAEPITFTLPDTNRTDWEVEVRDNLRTPNLLGTVEYDDSAADRTFEYELEHEGTPGTCETFTNVASIHSIGVSDLVGQLAGSETASDSTDAEICVQKPLEVTKTAIATYDRTYAWTITKVADRSSVETSGGSATFRYDVTVTPNGYTDSGWTMSGMISVTNPNDASVGAITAAVTDTTDVGATCTVTGGEDVVIDPGETVPLAYGCTFAQQPTYTGTNTARAEWTGFESARHAEGEAVVAFVLDQAINRYVSLTDSFDGGLPQPIANASGIDWLQGARTFTYTRSLGAPAGSCRTYPNTARIVETQQQSSASVTVCAEAGLQISKTVAAGFDRTYDWLIDKAADGTTFDTDGDAPATVGYTVRATPQVPADGVYDDSGFEMGGTITVTNPNTYGGGGITASVVDVPNVGTGVTCTVANGTSVALAPGQTVTLSYSCSFVGRPSYLGTNQATASWTGPDGAARSSSTGPVAVAFAIDSEVNKVVDVVDDKTQPGEAFDLGEATWNDEGTPIEFTYDLELTAEANECEEYTNTAEIVQTGNAADATVAVCGPEILPDEVIVPEPQPRPEPVVKGVETVLPDTGGPDAALMWTGLSLLLMGGILLLASRTRRSRT